MNSTLAVIRDFGEYVIENKITKTRSRRNVLYKYAYANALRRHFGCSEIGRIIGLHHATILHSFKTHESNASKTHNPQASEYLTALDDASFRIQQIFGEGFDPMVYWTRSEIIKAYRSLEKKYNTLVDAQEHSIEEQEVS